MSQVSTGYFTLVLPVVQGRITDTNGLPIAGVTLQGYNASPATTDTNGNYVFGLPVGTLFTVTPSNGNWIFVPPSRTYQYLSSSISNQDYTAVSSLSPALGVSAQTNNLSLTWYGIPGVHYQGWASTNLVDWFHYGSSQTGSNSTMQLTAPIGPDPKMFFRIEVYNY